MQLVNCPKDLSLLLPCAPGHKACPHTATTAMLSHTLSFLIDILFLITCIHVFVCRYVQVHAGFYRGHKGASEPTELE